MALLCESNQFQNINKRPMCHIANLRKQLIQHINLTHDYHNGNWEKKKNDYLLYKNWMVLHLNKLESPSTKNALCEVWLKLAQWLWGRRFFLISSMYFCYLEIISPWKRAGQFIWTNLTPLHPRTTDKIWSEKPSWPLSSGELKTTLSYPSKSLPSLASLQILLSFV